MEIVSYLEEVHSGHRTMELKEFVSGILKDIEEDSSPIAIK